MAELVENITNFLSSHLDSAIIDNHARHLTKLTKELVTKLQQRHKSSFPHPSHAAGTPDQSRRIMGNDYEVEDVLIASLFSVRNTFSHRLKCMKRHVLLFDWVQQLGGSQVQSRLTDLSIKEDSSWRCLIDVLAFVGANYMGVSAEGRGPLKSLKYTFSRESVSFKRLEEFVGKMAFLVSLDFDSFILENQLDYPKSVMELTRVILVQVYNEMLLFLSMSAGRREKPPPAVHQMAEKIIQQMIQCLDCLEMSPALQRVVEIIKFSALSFPYTFSRHYKTTVDIIVGWVVDSSVSSLSRTPLLDFLGDLFPFVRADEHISFLLDILASLMEDLENAVQVSCKEIVHVSVPLHLTTSIKPIHFLDSKIPTNASAIFDCIMTLLLCIFRSVNTNESKSNGNVCDAFHWKREVVPKLLSSSLQELSTLYSWCMEIVIHLGLKYDDRKWMSMGKRLVDAALEYKGGRFYPDVALEALPTSAKLFTSILRYHKYELKWLLEDEQFSQEENTTIRFLQNKGGHSFESDEHLIEDTRKVLADIKKVYAVWNLRDTSSGTDGIVKSAKHRHKEGRMQLSEQVAAQENKLLRLASACLAREFFDPYCKSGILFIIRRDLVSPYCCCFDKFDPAPLMSDLYELSRLSLVGISAPTKISDEADIIWGECIWNLVHEILCLIPFIGNISEVKEWMMMNEMGHLEFKKAPHSICLESIPAFHTVNTIESDLATAHQPSTEILSFLLFHDLELLLNTTEKPVFFLVAERSQRVPCRLAVEFVLVRVLIWLFDKTKATQGSLHSLHERLLTLCTTLCMQGPKADENDCENEWKYENQALALMFISKYVNDIPFFENQVLMLLWLNKVTQSLDGTWAGPVDIRLLVRCVDQLNVMMRHEDECVRVLCGQVMLEIAKKCTVCLKDANENVFSLLRKLVDASVVGQVFLVPLTDVSLVDTDRQVKKIFLQVYCSLSRSLFPYVSAIFSQEHPKALLSNDLISVMSTPHSGSFRSHHFQIWMMHLGMKEFLQLPEDVEASLSHDWLFRLYHNCQTDQLVSLSTLYTGGVDRNLNALKFWGNWESVRYCILSRLKTPLGNPQQTLSAIETFLNHLHVDVKELMNQSDCTLDTLLLYLARVGDFVQFIHLLEFQIRLSSLIPHHIQALPPATAAFFSSNLSICQDWLARIRPRILSAARMSGTSATCLVYHGYSYLLECETRLKGEKETTIEFLSDMSQHIYYLVEALRELQDPDSIAGVHSYLCKNILPLLEEKDGSAHILWTCEIVEYFNRVSKGNFELALETLNEVLKSECVLPSLYPSLFNEYYYLHSLIGDANSSSFLQTLSQSSTELQCWDTDFAYPTSPQTVENVSHKKDAVGISQIMSLGLKQYATRANFKKFDHLLSGLNIPEQAVDMSRLILESEKNLPMNRVGEGSSALSLLLFSGVLQSLSSQDHDLCGIETDGLSLGAEEICMILGTKFTRLLCNEKQKDVNEMVELENMFSCLASQLWKRGNLAAAKRIMDQSSQLFPVPSCSSSRELARINLSTPANESQAIQVVVDAFLRAPDHEQGCHSLLYMAEVASAVDSSDQISYIKRIQSVHSEYGMSEEKPLAEYALELATKKFPLYSKSWRSLAEYHYQLGETSLETLKTGSNDSILLNAVCSIAPQDSPLFTSVLQKMKQAFSEWMENLADVPDDTTFSASLQNEFPEVEPSVLDHAISCIIEQRASILFNFENAFMAYATFLNLFHDFESCMENRHVLLVVARIFGLLVKYGQAVCGHHVSLLEKSAVECWQSVIPQLFSGLDHPNDFVRNELRRLLSRIGQADPHRIVYKVVVGSLSATASSSAQAYAQIMSELCHGGSASTVEGVRKTVMELQRITVLPEEKVYHALLDFEHKLTRISHRENAQNECTNLLGPFRRELVSLMGPNPETPHEISVGGDFKRQIVDRLDAWEESKGSSLSISELISLIKELKEETGKPLHQTRHFKLGDLSPYLADFSCQSTPVPGIVDDNKYILSFETKVVGIPTKTKPKKITLLCQDGKKYSYLLKGMEDMNLDERIMQFMSTVNILLKADQASVKKDLSCRTFAVIPLGSQCGMVRWVNNMTPLFSFYKNWHQALKQTKGEDCRDNLRPHETFYVKVKEILKASKLPKGTSRKNWPLEKIFLELQKETPDCILEKEIMSSSPNSSLWYTKTKRFCYTLAVMSMIGYTVGLGDRHLDNILLDRQNGELLHIDFNVCFEKGLKLRIPETVPFRLTQNFVKALGILGTEGGFAAACKDTLCVMRSNKKILLTLLEAFIYDPLAHWKSSSAENEDISEKKMVALVQEEEPFNEEVDENQFLSGDPFMENENVADIITRQVKPTNTQAIQAFTRVKQKLDGMDFGLDNLTVEKQVNFAIAEARSVNNLASMYEGWMAWI